jgi:hypothetical protein
MIMIANGPQDRDAVAGVQPYRSQVDQKAGVLQLVQVAPWHRATPAASTTAMSSGCLRSHMSKKSETVTATVADLEPWGYIRALWLFPGEHYLARPSKRL